MAAGTNHKEPIAREAFPYMLAPALLAAVLWWWDLPWLALFFLVATIAIALFFRNPDRKSPEADGLVVSPADGTVVEIAENARSTNLDRAPLKRISIFMSVFNVHVNRSPMTGRVEKITYSKGKFLDAREKDASGVNEQNSLLLKSGEDTIEVVQVAGKVARRIACWVSEGDEMARGERFGLIHFGSRLDVYLGPEFEARVAVRARVRAGETVIAEKRSS
ncbi:MAG: phosphatidylserine decarboxylase family protein [Deltaproteobacteria bacterium]|nr:phosphatidylserine decarboxylase family protein [Deltaproteobacteria bacterium]